MATVNLDYVFQNFKGKDFGDDKISKSDLLKALEAELMMGKKTVNDVIQGLTQRFSFEQITLRDICLNVLGGDIPGEEGVTGKERVKRSNLGFRIAEHPENKEFVIGTEDVETLKKLIEKGYTNNIIVAKSFELLDPDGHKEDDTGE